MIGEKKKNVLMRGGALGVKFIFTAYAAKLLNHEDFVVFGLYVVSVGYGILVLGLEFHTYFNRQIVVSNKEMASKIVNTFFSFYYVIYLLMLMSCSVYTFVSGVSTYKLLILTLLLISEHLSQEISRVLIVQSRQRQATLLIFVRSASWCFIAAPLIQMLPNYSLIIILMSWLCGSLSSVLLGYIYMNQLNLIPRFSRVNLAWVKIAFRASFSMFLVSATTQFFFTFDRFIVKSSPDQGAAAAYVLFIASAMSVISLIDSGVMDFYKRQLLESIEEKDLRNFSRIFNSFRREVVKASTLLSLTLIVSMNFVIAVIGEKEYRDNITTLYIVVVAVYFFMLSAVPNTVLYLLNKGIVIVKIQLLGMMFFLIIGYSGFVYSSHFVVPVALLLVMFAMCLMKYYVAHRMLTGVPSYRVSDGY